MKILYGIFFIITTIVTWIVILIGSFVIAGNSANALLAAVAPLALLVPVWLYKTKKSLKSLSKVLITCGGAMVLYIPLSYLAVLDAIHNSPPGKDGLGFALGFPILLSMFIVVFGIALLAILALSALTYLLGRKFDR